MRRNSDDILVITAGAPRGAIGALCRLGGRACLGGFVRRPAGQEVLRRVRPRPAQPSEHRPAPTNRFLLAGATVNLTRPIGRLRSPDVISFQPVGAERSAGRVPTRPVRIGFTAVVIRPS
ncbi:hypothetical protein GTS_21750 [Gandjariella thermophila]|uniref:Uncharacterized protein n=1 Tax=Gandjariella thermophila TaxID=1931992 RepID=A0A4D4J620_9PSEU|nr:hypothetical protein GTS_21750 [Gandjariella thermophila]